MTIPDAVPPTHTTTTAQMLPEAWESWGIAARWNPTHLWHAPDENQ
jgi:hypothetical protein